jgi:hypothetical protein
MSKNVEETVWYVHSFQKTIELDSERPSSNSVSFVTRRSIVEKRHNIIKRNESLLVKKRKYVSQIQTKNSLLKFIAIMSKKKQESLDNNVFRGVSKPPVNTKHTSTSDDSVVVPLMGTHRVDEGTPLVLVASTTSSTTKKKTHTRNISVLPSAVSSDDGSTELLTTFVKKEEDQEDTQSHKDDNFTTKNPSHKRKKSSKKQSKSDSNNQVKKLKREKTNEDTDAVPEDADAAAADDDDDKKVKSEKSVQKKSTSVISKIRKTFQERVAECQAFRQEHGHCKIKTNHPSLGVWVQELRRNYKLQMQGAKPRRPIPQEQLDALNAIDFDWGTFKPNPNACAETDTFWDANFEALQAYQASHNGDCDVPCEGETKHLGIWVRVQRYQYHRKRQQIKSFMTKARMQKLQSIQFNWDGDRDLPK